MIKRAIIRPRRNLNQFAIEVELTSDNEPCPNPRIPTNANSSISGPLMKEHKIRTIANNNPTMTPIRRLPSTSNLRPTHVNVNAAMNVPAPYRLLAVVRSSPKSSMKKSKNSDTVKALSG